MKPSKTIIIILLLVLISISGYAVYFMYKESDTLSRNPCEVCTERVQGMQCIPTQTNNLGLDYNKK